MRKPKKRSVLHKEHEIFAIIFMVLFVISALIVTFAVNTKLQTEKLTTQSRASYDPSFGVCQSFQCSETGLSSCNDDALCQNSYEGVLQTHNCIARLDYRLDRDHQDIAYYNCVKGGIPPGAYCDYNSQCTTGLCTNNRCDSSQQSPPLQNQPPGAYCDDNYNCQSGVCTNNRCEGTPIQQPPSNGGGDDSQCSAIGGTCKWTSEGCNGSWEHNKCNANRSGSYLCCVAGGGGSSGRCQQDNIGLKCDGGYVSGQCPGDSHFRMCTSGWDSNEPVGSKNSGGNPGPGPGGGNPNPPACQALPKPPDLNFPDTIPGNTSTVDWPAVEGAVKYDVRLDDPANGWNGDCDHPNPGDVCKNGVPAATPRTSISFSPGFQARPQPYHFWYHAINDCGAGSPPGDGYITVKDAPASCPAFTIPKIDEQIVKPGKQTITWPAAPEAIYYSLRINDTADVWQPGSCNGYVNDDFCKNDVTPNSFEYKDFKLGHTYEVWYHIVNKCQEGSSPINLKIKVSESGPQTNPPPSTSSCSKPGDNCCKKITDASTTYYCDNGNLCFDDNICHAKSDEKPVASSSPTITTTLPLTNSSTTPTVDPACPLKAAGDADCDGKITVIDFEIWRKELLGELPTLKADFNGNGVIDSEDYATWKKNFNSNK